MYAQKRDGCNELIETAAELQASLTSFIQFFYKLRTGRAWMPTHPICRESHLITIARTLTQVSDGEITRLLIHCPPRYGKTELMIHFIAWCMARYPSSNWIYVSYSHSLASKQTQTIREIISHPVYRKLFGVELSKSTTAKDNFETTSGGSVYAVGAQGTITGRGAGVQGAKDFSGAVIIDDIHKPDEVTSDTMREGVKDWYLNTLQSRVNSPITPILFIGQRLHEDDLPANLISGYDGHKWNSLIIPAIDGAGNALNPKMHDLAMLQKMQETMPYVFASQYQQNPQPAGGSIFKPEWLLKLDYEPEIIATFITADTAETDKTYNDATVFSFWGIYKIKQAGVDTQLYGLHWLDCVEIWIEPKDLEDEFLAFYASCMRHKVQPKTAAIEKKSTGVTLVSVLDKLQGLHVIKTERNAASGNKTSRFLTAQPFVASKRITLPRDGKHTEMCIEHCRKITANNTHRRDDIADTLADAISIGLIDNLIVYGIDHKPMEDAFVTNILQKHKQRQQVRAQQWRK